jgi:hypothetical protein
VAVSANGWPVLDKAPPAITIPGTPVRLRVRAGDVATVLEMVVRRFHYEVEPLTFAVAESPGYDDWGWAVRNIRGSATVISNHASGTAVDLNATRHPRGARGTFTRRQIKAVRGILAATVDPKSGEPVVRWGEDFHTTVDGMHFEINAGDAAVRRVARKLTPTPRIRDPLEALMAMTEKERKALVLEVVDALLLREIQLGPAAVRELGKPVATVAQLLQAGPAIATDVRQAITVLEAKIEGLPEEVRALVSTSVKVL